MRAKKMNRRTQKYRDLGMMSTSDIIQDVYIAILSDQSRWINIDKTGYFINAFDMNSTRDAVFINKHIIRGFDLQGNIVCRRKYNPTHLMPLRKVIVASKQSR